jgi:hypothetical protein
MAMDLAFSHQLPQEDLYLTAGMAWQDLAEFVHPGPCRVIFQYMLNEQGFVGFPVQPTPASERAAEEGIQE